MQRSDDEAAGAGDVAAGDELAECGAGKRHEQQAPEPGEDAGERSQRSTRERLRARPGALRTQRRGGEVDDPGEHRQHPEHGERRPRDPGEAVDPRGEGDAGEDQHRTGKRGQHGPDDAHRDQRQREDPQHGVHRFFRDRAVRAASTEDRQ